MKNSSCCSEPCQFKSDFCEAPLPPNVIAFAKVANELADLYRRKNDDYGDSFGRSYAAYGPISALTRISDKFHRLEHLILEGSAQVDESLEDTLRDLASYAIMTIIARQEDK